MGEARLHYSTAAIQESLAPSLDDVSSTMPLSLSLHRIVLLLLGPLF